jgi:hypothetical protein
MTRVARCSCGSLRIEAEGEPTAVAVCHCIECQRRSGSVLSVGAHFPKQRVRVSGASKVYVRPTESGRFFRQHFCPECGTSVYWEGDMIPDAISIFVGCFGDPSFPVPTRSVWEQTRHAWVTIAPEVPAFTQSRESKRLR